MRKTKNVFCLCLVLIMPIGIATNDTDSSSVWLKFGGGTGQYNMVIESCTDREVYSNSYQDIGADLSCRPSLDQPIYLGLRAGHLSARIKSHPKFGNTLEHGYLNPHVALETRKFGIGVGLVRNLGPEIEGRLTWKLYETFYKFNSDFDFRYGKNLMSGHVRVGSTSSLYFLMTFYEGTPLVSQYGYMLLGFGYGGARRWHYLTGISIGFYEVPGVYLGVGHDLGKHGRPQFSFRIAPAENDYEGGVSLNWTLPIN